MDFIKPSFLFKYFFALMFIIGCQNKNSKRPELVSLDLLTGDIALCGVPNFGEVGFPLSCKESTNELFNLAISLLHSFEHDEAEKVFAKVIDLDPNCPMAYWGVAMSKFHTLWRLPTVHQLETGLMAIEIARSIQNKSEKETDYIDATANLYTDWDKVNHLTRTAKFANAMGIVYNKYPNDKETGIFYAYALLSAADLSDKTYKNQKEAGAILEQLFPDQPNHPGIAHYIIHSYDYPGLAHLALDAARKFAAIAPSSAHAQHMPSHIFTRLGLWEESIQSNLNATDAAKCYAEQVEMEGNWDEEVHGTDYLGYAYLQVGKTNDAYELLEYFKSIKKINRIGYKSAYPSAAIPARFYLETRNWNDAAKHVMASKDYPSGKFPWANGIVHFTRILGALHTNNIEAAKKDFEQLNICHRYLLNEKKENLVKENSDYMANQVLIMVKAADAWIQYYEGKGDQALVLMEASAELEFQTEKNPVTPCEVYPAQELLGDLLMKMGKPSEALKAYELNLKIRPNRFNGIYGAAIAAKGIGDEKKTSMYFEMLLKLTELSDSDRPEIEEAREFIGQIEN